MKSRKLTTLAQCDAALDRIMNELERINGALRNITLTKTSKALDCIQKSAKAKTLDKKNEQFTQLVKHIGSADAATNQLRKDLLAVFEQTSVILCSFSELNINGAQAAVFVAQISLAQSSYDNRADYLSRLEQTIQTCRASKASLARELSAARQASAVSTSTSALYGNTQTNKPANPDTRQKICSIM